MRVAVHPDAPDDPAPTQEAELIPALHPAHRGAVQIQDALRNQGAHPCPDGPDHLAHSCPCASDALDGVRPASTEDENLEQNLLQPLAGAGAQKLLSQKQIRQDGPDPSLQRAPRPR